MMGTAGTFALLGAGLLLGATGSVGPRYGDTLLAEAAARAGGALHIDARGKEGVAISVGPSVAGGVAVPLTDAMGNVIGTLTAARSARYRAAATAAWLSHRIYVANNLAEPDPFVVGAAHPPRAQALVEAMLTRFPDLVSLALHVAPTGGGNAIIASNFGRIGKAGDRDDLHVEQDGVVLREVTDDGRRLAVELPLLDIAARPIGALSISFKVAPGSDPQSAYRRALVVRDALARRIASRETLFAR